MLPGAIFPHQIPDSRHFLLQHFTRDIAPFGIAKLVIVEQEQLTNGRPFKRCLVSRPYRRIYIYRKDENARTYIPITKAIGRYVLYIESGCESMYVRHFELYQDQETKYLTRFEILLCLEGAKWDLAFSTIYKHSLSVGYTQNKGKESQ